MTMNQTYRQRTQAETEVQLEQHRQKREQQMQRCLAECQANPRHAHLYTPHKVIHERGLLEERLRYAREVMQVPPKERLQEALDFWVAQEIHEDEQHRSRLDLTSFGMGVTRYPEHSFVPVVWPRREYDMLPALREAQEALDLGEIGTALTAMLDHEAAGNPCLPEALDYRSPLWADVEIVDAE